MNKEFLSQKEYEHLQIFIKDDIMKEAVRKCLTEQIYSAGTVQPGVPIEKKNFAFACLRGVNGTDRSDEEAGRILRTIAEATGLVEGAFREIDSLKEVEEAKVKDILNNAR